MKCEVKVLPKEDLKIFWKIQKEYLDNYTFEDVKKNFAKNKDLYIGCYIKGELVGIAYGFIKKNLVILQGIGVKHKYWRKGLGTKIIKLFHKQAKKTGKKIVSVGSAADDKVEKFYLKKGYKPVSVQAKGENHFLYAEEKVRGYKTGLKKREKLF
jgi:GNAT superfamily N-acetyltransferase